MATQLNYPKKLNLFKINHLPSRFPEGTRFVIEGRAGRIDTQYLEFPDGRHIDLPTAPAIELKMRRMRRGPGGGRGGRKSGAGKI
jgi:hypothetical protein